MKYNYIFFNAPGSNTRRMEPNEYFNIAVTELSEMENVSVVSYPLDYTPYVIRFLFALHRSPKTNKLFTLPFKNMWYKYYFKDDFQTNRPFCFIFTSSIDNEKGYFRYLKKEYPNAKFVLMLRDLVEKQIRRHTGFDINYYKENFDLILSYNIRDVKEYGLVYFTSFGSWIPIDKDLNYPLSDVFFAGASKDRLDLLLQIYQRLTNAGLKCEFFITGVEKKYRIYLPGITYSDKPMLYREMLYRTINSRCVLEITQKDAYGFTSRFFEAVMYNKKLITNNAIVLDTKFYNPKYILYFQSSTEIDPDFIKEDLDDINYHYQGEYSPKRMIELIERELTTNDL